MTFITAHYYHILNLRNICIPAYKVRYNALNDAKLYLQQNIDIFVYFWFCIFPRIIRKRYCIQE